MGSPLNPLRLHKKEGLVEVIDYFVVMEVIIGNAFRKTINYGKGKNRILQKSTEKIKTMHPMYLLQTTKTTFKRSKTNFRNANKKSLKQGTPHTAPASAEKYIIGEKRAFIALKFHR